MDTFCTEVEMQVTIIRVVLRGFSQKSQLIFLSSFHPFRNANVECHTKKGCTPFHLACKEGHLEIGVQLLEKGADTEVTN